MAQKPFFLILMDENARTFTVEGPMIDDRAWNKAVVDAQRVGRKLRYLRTGLGDQLNANPSSRARR